MTKENLLRLAISMEDSAATTIDKYLCKLVECTLFESSKDNLGISEICIGIKNNYTLQFDILEVENAIRKKGRNRILKKDNKYYLSPKARDSINNQSDMLCLLREHIREFHKINTVIEIESFTNLMIKYLYHCINSNINNLMSLMHVEDFIISDSFYASNDEIDNINSFIVWDNNEKNKFLYSIVSFSYEYCMLATKKDTLLSQAIFNSKRFILDTNIIFRMAGINKDERQYVTTSFFKKCKEVGIELYYTNETLGEINRVITGQIKYIKYITQCQEPVEYSALESINNNQEINDFYEIYYKWSRRPENKYYDFPSFQSYLFNLIQGVISDMHYIDIPNYGVGKDIESFENKCASLMIYKNEKRPLKPVSKESLQTDINNIIYTLNKRKNDAGDIWSTNDFIVSADQLLTNWAREVFPGIPIVVIPSVWLSIILRFSGRSEDDYKAYCHFLNLRHHPNNHDLITINPEYLLTSLAKMTINKDVKEKIIAEIMNNRDAYLFETPDDYSSSIKKAFDKIVAGIKEENRKDMENIQRALKAEKTDKETDNILREQKNREETLIKLSNRHADDRISHFPYNSIAICIIWILVGIFFLGSVLSFIYKLNPIYGLYIKIIPESFNTDELRWDLFKFIFTGVTAIFPLVLGKIYKYLGSEDRRKKLYQKFYNQGKKALDDEPIKG